MKIQFVPLEWVNQTWPQVEAFVASALDHSKGEYTAEHAKVMATNGQWQLLVATTDQGIEGAAREAVARLWTRYGFTEKYRIVGVKL